MTILTTASPLKGAVSIRTSNALDTALLESLDRRTASSSPRPISRAAISRKQRGVDAFAFHQLAPDHGDFDRRPSMPQADEQALAAQRFQEIAEHGMID